MNLSQFKAAVKALPWKAVKRSDGGLIRYGKMCPIEAVYRAKTGFYQDFNYAAEKLMLSRNVFHAILAAADGRGLEGDVTERKDIKNLRKFFLLQTKKRKK
jgi:hypothetical protein